MDQPRKVAKPARDQLNREIKCLEKNPCRCIRGKYIYMYWYNTAVCICLYNTRYIFYLGTCAFVHGSLLLYMHMYVTTAVCM